jgi:DNA modification methylase
VAKELGRFYIGIEISDEYCQLAEGRVRQTSLFEVSSDSFP